jgi:hypothetical protein
LDRGDHAPGTGYADVADPDGCVLEIDQRVRKGATPTLDPSEQSRAGDENRTRVLSLGSDYAQIEADGCGRRRWSQRVRVLAWKGPIEGGCRMNGGWRLPVANAAALM